ncbi:H(+)/Cl(-) exchange transporter 7-like isoform X6 [Rhodnius prolixus]|uniref:H(+)/Cl(-) exchange transporter 7-like isoform X6 n=1 Tax=Rhodnius prolixus TaxID=13249 RepID=UPI003D18D54C
MHRFTRFCPFSIPQISPCYKRYSSHIRRESKIIVLEDSKYEKVVSTFEEGAIMHIGVILGVLISMMRIPFKNVRCFKLLQNDRERRDMASMGFAAGVCAAFIAPVGGVVLALEEGISYGTKALTTNILFSSVITSFTSATIKLILIRQCVGCILEKDLLFLTDIENPDIFMKYQFFEIPFFILIGIIGGLMGSAWNCLEVQISYWRQKYIKKNRLKILEVVVVSSVTAMISLIILFSVTECNRGGLRERTFVRRIKWHCAKGQLPTVVLFFFQNDVSLMNTLICDERLMGVKPLLVLLVYYFILSAIYMGTAITGGVFVPNIITGAIWGRLLAELLLELVPQTDAWCRPQMYAFLAAGAHVGGTTRICLSIGIILLESSGEIAFGLPVLSLLPLNLLLIC